MTQTVVNKPKPWSPTSLVSVTRVSNSEVDLVVTEEGKGRVKIRIPFSMAKSVARMLLEESRDA